ncbi:unnamed protein product, partial [Meganyctiphanes norvegica]
YSNMFSVIWTTLYWWTRPFIKWFLRHSTKLCELQRICYGEYPGAQRTRAVEFSLNASKIPEIKKVTKYMDGKCTEYNLKPDIVYYAVFAIVRAKKINTKIHKRLSNSLGECMMQIWGYKQLVAQIEVLRQQPYNSDLEEHENALYKLWEALNPGIPLEARISKQWQDIGFQGDDPKTDFRGMGMLGLENILYFSTEHSDAARHTLARSLHPQYGYSWAIVGINITHMAYNFLSSGEAKYHFWNATNGMPSVQSFHNFFCYLFFEFDTLWRREQPKDIMEFNRIRDKFDKNMKAKLKDPTTFLKCTFVIKL